MNSNEKVEHLKQLCKEEVYINHKAGAAINMHEGDLWMYSKKKSRGYPINIDDLLRKDRIGIISLIYNYIVNE